MPDIIDKQLVQLLAIDALQTSKELGKQLNISGTTVRRRMQKLIRNNLLRIQGVVDPKDFGLPLAVVITIDVENSKLTSALDTLVKEHSLRMVSTTTGRFNIMAFGRFATHESLSDFMTTNLARLKGLRDSETYICLNVLKGHYIPFVT